MKLRTHPYHPTCGYYSVDGKFHCGIPLYVRGRDKTLFIILNGIRVDVALVSSNGMVVRLAPEAILRSKSGLL